MTVLETQTRTVDAVPDEAPVHDAPVEPELTPGERFMGFTAPMPRDWLDLDLTSLRPVEVDCDNPTFVRLYERCGARLAYPLGAQACHRAVIIMKDIEVNNKDRTLVLSAPLAAATVGVVGEGDDRKAVVGSAAVGERFRALSELAIVEYAMGVRAVETGIPHSYEAEFTLARQFYEVAVREGVDDTQEPEWWRRGLELARWQDRTAYACSLSELSQTEQTGEAGASDYTSAA